MGINHNLMKFKFNKMFIGILMIIALAGSVSAFSCGTDTVQDIDGNTYNTVEIGTQCWMKENMRTTKYPDGTAITDGTALTSEWATDVAMYSCPPNAANTGFDCAAASTLGMFYQWSAAMNCSITVGAQGICPTGWHVPTDAEQHTLDGYLDTGTCDPARIGLWDCAIAGDKLKTATDCFGGVSCASSGFEALLAGHRGTDGSFGTRGTDTGFWSSLESGTNAWRRTLFSSYSMVHRRAITKAFGLSVRCLYDGVEPTPTTSNFTSEETTNFSAVADITNVTNLTLAVTDKGKIKFPESTEINAEAQDYDTNIIIEDGFISVNTAALDESFNTSATITLEGVTCPVDTITYQEGTFTSKDDIIAGGSNCELDGVCSNIQCIGTNLTFDVAHFTGFAAGADANLTTQAEAGVFYPLDSIEFTAEYINSTDGTPHLQHLDCMNTM